MANQSWVEGFPGAITVCDREGIVLEMNDQAALVFEQAGGKKLIGSNLLDCHPEPARSKLKQMMETQQVNVYTIEKKGKKKLIYQTPWYQDDLYCGFVELSLEIPFDLPHSVRG